MATGSASPVLADKTRESGLGRWITIQVPTLSFYEYCRLLEIQTVDLPSGIKPTQLYLLDESQQSDIINKLSFLQAHFIRYLQIGGFPELALSKDDIYAQRILREDIVDKALKRDLPSLYAIRNVSDIEKLLSPDGDDEYVIFTISSSMSASNVKVVKELPHNELYLEIINS